MDSMELICSNSHDTSTSSLPSLSASTASASADPGPTSERASGSYSPMTPVSRFVSPIAAVVKAALAHPEDNVGLAFLPHQRECACVAPDYQPSPGKDATAWERRCRQLVRHLQLREQEVETLAERVREQERRLEATARGRGDGKSARRESELEALHAHEKAELEAAFEYLLEAKDAEAVALRADRAALEAKLQESREDASAANAANARLQHELRGLRATARAAPVDGHKQKPTVATGGARETSLYQEETARRPSSSALLESIAQMKLNHDGEVNRISERMAAVEQELDRERAAGRELRAQVEEHKVAREDEVLRLEQEPASQRRASHDMPNAQTDNPPSAKHERRLTMLVDSMAQMKAEHEGEQTRTAARLKAAEEDLRREKDAGRALRSQMKERGATHEEEVQRLERELALRDEAVTSAERALAALREKMNGFLGEGRKLLEQNDAAQREAADVQGRLVTALADLSRAQTRHIALQADHATLRGAHTQLEQQLEALENQMERQVEEMAGDHEDQLKRMSEDLEAVERELQKEKDRGRKLHALLHEMEKQAKDESRSHREEVSEWERRFEGVRLELAVFKEEPVRKDYRIVGVSKPFQTKNGKGGETVSPGMYLFPS